MSQIKIMKFYTITVRTPVLIPRAFLAFRFFSYQSVFFRRQVVQRFMRTLVVIYIDASALLNSCVWNVCKVNINEPFVMASTDNYEKHHGHYLFKEQ